MAAQHKRPGRTAKMERKKRIQERISGRAVAIQYRYPKRAQFGPGKVVAAGEYIA